MSIDWQNLRPLNGSKHSAFEELCCQLAAYEDVQPGSTFIRKGTPDAGVECFWKLPNGKEWAWQAKFFLSRPEDTQWKQIDGSVKTALEKHPKLTSYKVCLPIDRADPRKDGEKWFMDKWNDHVEMWQEWASKKGMSVEFDYWGEHEILERLSREEHRGRHFFWFNKDLFSHQWFENRISETISNAGPRYTPELNVDLPISKIFGGLGRTTDFYNNIKIIYGETKREYSRHKWKYTREFAGDDFESLKGFILELFSILENIGKSQTDLIDFDSIADLTSKSEDIIEKCSKTLIEIEEQQKAVAGKSSHNPSENVGYERHHLYGLMNKIGEIEEFARSNEAHLANISALLLVGDAGTGKTHLFCDIAKQRTNEDIPTVLLLGEHFKDDEPWSQITRLLGLSCDREVLLGAIEAAAEARGSRALILIDALNEGEGKKLWGKYLAGMLKTLAQYPRIGIAVSVRSIYEDIVIPDGLVSNNNLIRVVHTGFADHEYQATRTFFDYFGIEQPSVPLMVPEFQNPLFLKIFCKGLKNIGLTKIPSGLRGITSIFNFFIESVNEKLSKPDHLDLDRKSKIVLKAVERIAEMMADKNSRWLTREDAQNAINSFLSRDGYENSLFRHMVSEGLLAEDRFPVEGVDGWCEGIRFTYELFGDHLIAKHLLDKYLDSDSPTDSFLPDKRLGSFVKDDIECWRNRGLIEAFSIQVPERIGKELVEVTPECADFLPIREAFVESLIWRDTSAFTDATVEYINNGIILYEDAYNKFLNALLTVASNPDHPYNADFLHGYLMDFELADRDQCWSIFLHGQWGWHEAVDRFVSWAWSSEDKSHIDDESIRLSGIALAWFLTTSNRFLRDRSTKALVSLLTSRIHVLRLIMHEFREVNDPYVLERLFAVAYGCAMRSQDNEAIAKLAEDIYEQIFKDGMPPAHILLRDYARGVIELALHHGIELDIELEKIRPPYKSEWPNAIPTKEELKKYGEWQKDMPDEEWARVHLYESVMGGIAGDFSHYIIGTDFGSGFEWSSRRLDEPRKPSRKELYEDFIQSLTDRQKSAWVEYKRVIDNVSLYRRLNDSARKDIFGCVFTEEELEVAIKIFEQNLRKTLGKKKLSIFEEHVIPYLKEPNLHEEKHIFDLSIAQCWILHRVLDMGWTVERFGRFDRFLSLRRGREASKPERIGKKYQWIAYHEFLARVSDNFEFKGRWSDREEKFDGPWQMHIRDIDPSCLLRKTTSLDLDENYAETWWFPSSYDTWDSEPDDVNWLKSIEDLPEIEPLIEVTNPEDGTKWLVLEASFRWKSPTSPEEEYFENPKREIWYLLKSYIVKKQDMDVLFEWAKQQNFENRWMPESQDIHRVFLGEFFWSPAFEYCNYNDWTRGDKDEIPKDVLVSAVEYSQETGDYDCSIDEGFNIYLPSKHIVGRMGLGWDGVEGCLFDDKSVLIAFDPSVKQTGPGILLMKKDAFLRFLDDNGYDILWTVLGEKNILSAMGDWKGRLEINGVYRMFQGKIDGEFHTGFIS